MEWRSHSLCCLAVTFYWEMTCYQITLWLISTKSTLYSRLRTICTGTNFTVFFLQSWVTEWYLHGLDSRTLAWVYLFLLASLESEPFHLMESMWEFNPSLPWGVTRTQLPGPISGVLHIFHCGTSAGDLLSATLLWFTSPHPILSSNYYLNDD